MNHSTITVKTNVSGGIKKVWEYYTNPIHITNWNFADPSWHCPRAQNDLRVGGTYMARMEAKDGSTGFDFEAIYSQVAISKGFKYEFGGRNARVQFNVLGDQIEVVITFDAENENPIEMQKRGWQNILDNFKTYTQSN
ncbi:SRPBCC domain-containing protein [Pedobacter lithocola]|uniref:SRPBCC domain-containing protein n=1 Tax=Pedobacter lithocola TaxID=1908239 RepID=A0ABV8PDS7_9SPHI